MMIRLPAQMIVGALIAVACFLTPIWYLSLLPSNAWSPTTMLGLNIVDSQLLQLVSYI